MRLLTQNLHVSESNNHGGFEAKVLNAKLVLTYIFCFLLQTNQSAYSCNSYKPLENSFAIIVTKKHNDAEHIIQ